MMSAELTIQAVENGDVDNLAAARCLFEEYGASLGFSLCFQAFDQELASLPGQYTPPNGCLLIALWRAEPVGCVGVRRLHDSICEMKRLYVRAPFRRFGIGRSLALAAIDQAQTQRYSHIRLDTLSSMRGAIRLYETLGFVPIAPYRENPMPDAEYFELAMIRT